MRTVVLALLAVGVALLAVFVRAPERETGAAAVSGARLVRLPRHAVRRLEVSLDGQHFTAVRDGTTWRLDDRPTSVAVTAALEDLTDALIGLRAVDQFRGAPQRSFGLDAPRGTVLVVSGQREVRLTLGAFSASTSTVYARRAGDPRVFQVGTYLLAQIGRVLDRRAAADRPE